ncbi:hypothetical protein OOZ15_15610 [Galbibacter sp. EGI 63066]|uniref:hypothetical protein n=1 Tax=Galbibacter sp. EGI 63066 TaxID=2993559 RepID=UPI002249577A|nr:hypothetical protein [Galbibacter sp. EGI 63066]MCX2681380.1 hypothetical protein [Galbibacter sp. EGI 63066]
MRGVNTIGFIDKLGYNVKMKISKNIIPILILVILANCTGTKSVTELSNLIIENKSANKLIENRIPDYGLTGRDGCVIMDEISMDIIELRNNYVRGKVFNSKSNDPLFDARLNLYLNTDKQTDTIKFNANSNGYFEKEFKGSLEKIKVEYIAYRNLIIDFKKL